MLIDSPAMALHCFWNKLKAPTMIYYALPYPGPPTYPSSSLPTPPLLYTENVTGDYSNDPNIQ